MQDRLEGLDYADDICLLSHSVSDMQPKLDLVSETAKLAELKMNSHKTETLRMNANAERKLLI